MKAYIEANKDRFLNELVELLRIPSVSAASEHKEDVRRAAEFVKERLLDAGCEEAALHETPGHPIVFGEKLVSEAKPTVLVYGHYDVQPPDPLDLWENPPFEPKIKDNKVVARGAADDKGQMYLHVKALETLMHNGELPCNIKFLIEGEEEVGSNSLEQFVLDNQDLLAADVVLISDTSMLSNDTPSITVGLRGMCYLEVEVTGPNRDLHSGTYGGAVANPINMLSKMIASLHDENNHITIPGFYDDVAELSPDERADMARAPFDLTAYQEALDIEAVHGEEGFTTFERIGIRPTLDVNGIWGGYTGEGSKTVLPSKAYAKISMRLVPHQSSKKIESLFLDHFQNLAPESVKVKVTTMHGAEPVVTPTVSTAYEAASRAMEKVWGKRPIPTRDGGSIPVVQLFEDRLGVNVILMGFGLDEDAIHSPNESFGLTNYFKGIETVCEFYREYDK